MSINARKNKLKGFNFNRYANIDLTNRGYVKLLHFILKSKKPLTSYQIQHGLGESKYVIEMLNNLFTASSSSQPLFTWEKIYRKDYEINEDKNLKKRLYRLLNTIYKLDWFEEADDRLYDHLFLSKRAKIITLSYDKTKRLKISLPKNKDIEENKEDNEVIIKIREPKIRHHRSYICHHSYILNAIRKKDGLHVYAEVYYNPRAVHKYLDVEYGPEVNRLDPKAKKLYTGNFRGFLLYLAGEYRHGWSQSGKERIREVISNSSLTKKIPFLKYWKDFEYVGFDVLDILMEIIIDFNKIITRHYQNYSHDYNTYEDDDSPIVGMNAKNTSDDNLKLILTERYRWAVLSYFADFENPTILSSTILSKQYSNYKNLKIEDKLNEYNLEMLKNQRNLLSRRLDRIDVEINIGHPLYPLPFL